MKSIIKCLTVLAALLLLLAGCEYDVAEPQWTKEHVNPPEPVISSVEPDGGALPGVNIITINGNNFAAEEGRNRVYFSNIEVEVLSSSASAIQVRRPNLVSDDAMVKVVSYDALLVAEYGPYPVSQVHQFYGNFIENLALAALTVDQDENLYVVESTSRNIVQIKPSGEKTLVGVGNGAVSDLKVSPAGQLILLFNNREIQQVNPDAVVDTAAIWVEVASRVKFGDFDSNGNFYCGTRSSDLIIIKGSDLSSKKLGVYARDEIFDVQARGGYVYVLVEARSTEPAMAIWRHAILDADGNLGAQELVLDWSQTGEYAESIPTGFTLDAQGNLYVSTNYVDPIFVLYADGTQDIYYKDILPTPVSQFVWGNGTYLYLIWDADSDKNVVRVDMGVEGPSAM
jgi:sugar lactone lactonase YvrE